MGPPSRSLPVISLVGTARPVLPRGPSTPLGRSLCHLPTPALHEPQSHTLLGEIMTPEAKAGTFRQCPRWIMGLPGLWLLHRWPGRGLMSRCLRGEGSGAGAEWGPLGPARAPGTVSAGPRRTRLTKLSGLRSLRDHHEPLCRRPTQQPTLGELPARAMCLPPGPGPPSCPFMPQSPKRGRLPGTVGPAKPSPRGLAGCQQRPLPNSVAVTLTWLPPPVQGLLVGSTS